MGRLPGGVFLQPAFTWSRITPEGDVELGVHPLLVGLVGSKPEFQLDPAEDRVERGRPLLRLGAGDRSLALRSPVSGTIVGRNRRPRGADSWDGAVESDGAWLCRIRPDDLGREISTWMVGERAQDWTRRQYGRIRDHLQRAVATGSLGVALADGGEIPFGALAEMETPEWDEFQETFLHA
jgi:glycine cleavage system H lipoate-binding protein